jgi:hypothetical protein
LPLQGLSCWFEDFELTTNLSKHATAMMMISNATATAICYATVCSLMIQFVVMVYTSKNCSAVLTDMVRVKNV